MILYDAVGSSGGNEDDRIIYEFCFCLLDEMEDIIFSCSMCIKCIEALVEATMEYFHIPGTQLESFVSGFVHHLSKYIQEALERQETAA